MRFGTCAIFLLSACGAVQNPAPPAGDDTGDDDTGELPPDDVPPVDMPPVDMPPDDMPDAGVPEMPDAPPPPPVLTIQTIATAIRDERGDVVTFSGGVPHHAHAGTSIALGGTDCPDVFKYAYLLDTAAPAFGDEAQTNPLAFRWSSNLPAVGEYRVRSATATLLDWSSATTDNGQFVAELHRDGTRKISQLGTLDGDFFIDLRVRDGVQEAVTTACWKHHPMAAPIEVSPLVPSTSADAIPSFTITTAATQLAQLMSVIKFPIYEATYTQGTAERSKLRIELPIPTATFTRLGVIDIVPVIAPASFSCGAICQTPGCTPIPATDPRCTAPTGSPVDPLDTPVTAPLSTGIWAISITDGNGTPVSECTIESATSVSCDVAGRKTGESALTRHVLVTLGNLTDLKPADGAIAKRTLDGLEFIGPPAAELESHCAKITLGQRDSAGRIPKTCIGTTSSFQMAALDSFHIDFDPATLLVSSAIPGNALSTVAYAPTGVTGSAFVWDGGDADLPGTSH